MSDSTRSACLDWPVTFQSLSHKIASLWSPFDHLTFSIYIFIFVSLCFVILFTSIMVKVQSLSFISLVELFIFYVVFISRVVIYVFPVWFVTIFISSIASSTAFLIVHFILIFLFVLIFAFLINLHVIYLRHYLNYLTTPIHHYQNFNYYYRWISNFRSFSFNCYPYVLILMCLFLYYLDIIITLS